MVSVVLWPGYLDLTVTDIDGRPGIDPFLILRGQLHASHFGPGATVLLLPHLWAEPESNRGRLDFGVGQPVSAIVAFRPIGTDKDDKPIKVPVELPFSLSGSAVYELERLRDGKGLNLYLDTEVIRVTPGAPPEGGFMDSPEPIGTTRLHQNSWRVTPEQWGGVMRQWGIGASVPLLVTLPDLVNDNNYRDIVARLHLAWQRMNAGEYKESVRETREAIELLRALLPGQMSDKAKRERDVDQRSQAILESLRGYVQALFEFDSAAVHTDDQLRNVTWIREDALLALATAAAMAQRLMSRTAHQYS